MKPNTPAALPPGIRRTPTGYQAYVHIRGRMHSRRFPPQTALVVMKRWREETRVRAHLGSALPAAGPLLAASVRSYLAQVQTMPTWRFRRDDLRLWLAALGDRPLAGITSSDVRAQLERWRSASYAANTCNHRRTALMHLYATVAPDLPNPVRAVPRYRDESLDAPPRALSAAARDRLLAAMPASVTKARLTLLAWTGWPPAQIAKIEPSDIQWDKAVRLRPRRKGKGAAGVWLPLLPHGWAALREFKRLGAWGAFSTSSARTSLRRAARTARRTLATEYARKTINRAEARRIRTELLDVTPYQFRHSFASLVAAVTGDDRAVMILLQQSDIRTTHRYTEATADPRAVAALGLVAQVTGESVPGACQHGEDRKES